MSYLKTEKYGKDITRSLTESFETILQEMGEDPLREGLAKTPERAAKAIQFLTQGYNQDADAIL